MPGEDKYPGGGPHTIGVVQVQRSRCGVAATPDGSRYEM